LVVVGCGLLAAGSVVSRVLGVPVVVFGIVGLVMVARAKGPILGADLQDLATDIQRWTARVRAELPSADRVVFDRDAGWDQAKVPDGQSLDRKLLERQVACIGEFLRRTSMQ
jgi:hypothetical protein